MYNAKRLLKFSLLAISILGVLILSAFSLVACDDAHTHAFSEWQIVLDPTCTTEGLKTRECACGEHESQIIPVDPTAHNIEMSIETPATCKTSGLKKLTCTICGDTQTEEIPIDPSAHAFTDWTVLTEAKCTTKGLQTRTCKLCEKQEEQDIAPLGHEFSAWTTTRDNADQAMCEGTHTRICIRQDCNEIEQGDCQYDTVVIAPTCESEGTHIHTCTVCNDSFEHQFGEPTGHKWGKVYTHINSDGEHKHQLVCLNDSTHTSVTACQFEEETVDPTCTMDGFIRHTCKFCGFDYSTPGVESTGHVWGGWTTKADGIHNYYHTKECNICHEKETGRCTQRITYTPATCTEDARNTYTCTTCGKQYSISISHTALGHAWQPFVHDDDSLNGNSTHSQLCSRCNTAERKNIPCTFVETRQEATCESAGRLSAHCEVCQYSYEEEDGNALGHSLTGWQHIPGTNQHKNSCKKCSYSDTQTCDYETVEDFQPTCTNEGQKTNTCSLCKDKVIEKIPALGHLFSTPKTPEEYNEYNNITETTHTQTCLRPECGETITGNHTFINSNLCDSCGYDGLIYEERNGGYVVLSDEKVSGAKEIIIPETHNKKQVIEIESGLKSNNGKLCGFMQNISITKVTLPQSLKIIGSYAFDGCKNLTQVVIRGEGEEDFNPQLTTIGRNAFSYCYNLRSAGNLPSTLTTIGQRAFYDCTALEDIVIPSSVLDIGELAFYNTKFVNNRTHWTGHVLYINNHLVLADKEITGSYEILEDTLNISAEAFKDCVKLTRITIPSSVIEIDNNAFLNCTGLQKVIYNGDFEDWLQIIFANDHSSPMNYASELSIAYAHDSIVIPNGTLSIPAGTFKNTQITSVTIPESVTYIGDEAFEGSKLESITLTGDVKFTFVGRNAFADTPYFKNASKWTNGILYIGHCVCATNGDLPSIVELDESTVSISPYAFEGNNTLQQITLSTSLTFIGEHAFVGCSALKKVIFTEKNNWFAQMDNNLVGRGIKSDDLNNSTYNDPIIVQFLTKSYIGEWVRNYKVSSHY